MSEGEVLGKRCTGACWGHGIDGLLYLEEGSRDLRVHLVDKGLGAEACFLSSDCFSFLFAIMGGELHVVVMEKEWSD